MNAFCYFASIQKSTTVTSSVVLMGLETTDKVLYVAKKNRVSVFKVTETGLLDQCEVTIFARILHLTSLRDAQTGDLLVIFTDQMKVLLADRNWLQRDIVEFERDQKSMDYAPLFAKDPQERVICAHMTKATLQLIWVSRVTSLSLRPSFEHQLVSFAIKVVDIAFVDNSETPRLCVLSEESQQLQLKVYEVSHTGLTPVQDWSQLLSGVCGRLFPLSTGKMAVACPQTLHISAQSSATADQVLSYDFGKITTTIKIDPNRWMIANENRHIFVFCQLGNSLSDTHFSVLDLGEASSANTISYLDNGFFYLGSNTDDNIVIQVSQAGGLVIEQKTQNLSPIVDMKVLSSEFHHEPEFVLCTSEGPGAVTVMSNNISVQIEAEIEVGKVTGMWPAAKTESKTFDYLILSYLAETRVQELSNSTLNSVEIPGFDHDTSTLLAGNVGPVLAQLTTSAVNFIDLSTQTLVCCYRPLSPSLIQQGSICGSRLLLVTSDNVVTCLSYGNRRVTTESTWPAPHEISCVVCSDIYAIVGVWTEFTIRIMKLPDLLLTWTEQVSLEFLPRSLLIKQMGTEERLFCGLGDGSLLVYTFHEGRIENQRNLMIGREAAQFCPLNDNRVLISSNSPTIAYIHNGQLLLRKLNLDNVQVMCNFTNSEIPDCLAAVIKNQLTLMRVSTTHYLSLTRYKPERNVHRVQLLDDSFIILSSKTTDSKTEWFVQVIEKVSELSYQYPFDDDMHATSLLVQGQHIIAGASDEEHHYHCLYVFSFSRHEIALVSSVKVEAYPLCIKPIGEGNLAIVLGKKLSLWSLEDSGNLVHKFTSLRAHSTLVAMDVFEDVIAVGDMIKAVSLYKVIDGELLEFAHLSKILYVMDVALLSKTMVLVADVNRDMFLFRYNGTKTLEHAAAWNMLDKVTCLRTCSVSTLMSELEFSQVCYYATVEGEVGLIATISEERYHLLVALQDVLSNFYSGKRLNMFKSLTYADMRRLVNYRPKEAMNFIDGDMLQLFLHLPWHDQETVAMEMAAHLPAPKSVPDLQKLISSFSLLH